LGPKKSKAKVEAEIGEKENQALRGTTKKSFSLRISVFGFRPWGFIQAALALTHQLL